MIPFLPYILISLLSLVMVLSLIYIIRVARRSISTVEERLQTLESSLELIELALSEESSKKSVDTSSDLEERLQRVETDQESLKQSIKDQTVKSAEEIAAKTGQLKEGIRAFFTASIESVLKKTAESETGHKIRLEQFAARIASLEEDNIRISKSLSEKKIEPVEPLHPEVKPEQAYVPPPQPEPPPLDPANAKARRLARLIVSEIALYNRKLLEDGVRNNTFNRLLEHDIKEAHALYTRRVSDEIRNSTSYLEEAFADLIAKTKRELNL
ncbi:MAG: hypothetical protein WCG31_10470 [Deltaproteobacteria bacterium]